MMLRPSLDETTADLSHSNPNDFQPLFFGSEWPIDKPFRLASLDQQPFQLIEQALRRHPSDPIPPTHSLHEERERSEEEEEEEEEDYVEENIWTTPLPTTPSYTLSWERLTQPPSSDRMFLAKQGIGTLFLTETPLHISEPIIKSLEQNSPLSTVVKEEQLVKGLVSALTGTPSACFRWDAATHTFQPRKLHFCLLGVSPDLLENAISTLLTLGAHLKRLDEIAQVCKSNPSRYGLVGMAFGCCIADICLHIHQAILSLPELPTVLQLCHFTEGFSLVIKRLAYLCHIDRPIEDIPLKDKEAQRLQFSIPLGAGLLSLLANEVKSFEFSSQGNSVLYKQICLAMLCETSRPYMDILSRWLGLSVPMSEQDPWMTCGSLGHRDPYHEFFVNDKKAFNGSYSLRQIPILPWCISPQQAKQILRTGNALRLLQQCYSDTSLGHSIKSNLSLIWQLTNEDCLK
ncbi:Spc98 family-domain-containing protein [Spinellus fusiger]|nr:Spc98 family-domain-containing protein [Spinellus fusiger]